MFLTLLFLNVKIRSSLLWRTQGPVNRSVWYFSSSHCCSCRVDLIFCTSSLFISQILQSGNHFALQVGMRINLDQVSLGKQVIAGQDPTFSEHLKTNSLNVHRKCSVVTWHVGLAVSSVKLSSLLLCTRTAHSTSAWCSWIRHRALISMKESQAYISTGHDKIKNRFIIWPADESASRACGFKLQNGGNWSNVKWLSALCFCL